MSAEVELVFVFVAQNFPEKRYFLIFRQEEYTVFVLSLSVSSSTHRPRNKGGHTHFLDPRLNILDLIKLRDGVGDAPRSPVEESTGRSFARIIHHRPKLTTAREELPFHVNFHTLNYPGDTYLDRWETLDTLICTQSLVFIGIAVDGVKWEEGVETESSLAVLWYHTLTVLVPPRMRIRLIGSTITLLTPHQGATNATMLVCYRIFSTSSSKGKWQHTFAFIACLNPFALSILTWESFGNIAADANEGANASDSAST